MVGSWGLPGEGGGFTRTLLCGVACSASVALWGGGALQQPHRTRPHKKEIVEYEKLLLLKFFHR